jgi:hypothetical protein
MQGVRFLYSDAADYVFARLSISKKTMDTPVESEASGRYISLTRHGVLYLNLIAWPNSLRHFYHKFSAILERNRQLRTETKGREKRWDLGQKLASWLRLFAWHSTYRIA